MTAMCTQRCPIKNWAELWSSVLWRRDTTNLTTNSLIAQTSVNLFRPTFTIIKSFNKSNIKSEIYNLWRRRKVYATMLKSILITLRFSSYFKWILFNDFVKLDFFLFSFEGFSQGFLKLTSIFFVVLAPTRIIES